jgi:hypothetical protein
LPFATEGALSPPPSLSTRHFNAGPPSGHFCSNPFSAEVPLRLTPFQCGQSSPWLIPQKGAKRSAAAIVPNRFITAMRANVIMVVVPWSACRFFVKNCPKITQKMQY